MKKLLLFTFAAVLFVGCSDCNDGPSSSSRKAVWESYTHSQLLGLQGSIKTLKQIFTIEGEENPEGEALTYLEASFDASGNCTHYNDTGIDPDWTPGELQTRGWGKEAAWYDYTYDAAGRLTQVKKSEVGAEPVTYTISYGAHTNYIPAPFPMGNITPFMLRGVTRIEANGYLLTADDKTATATAIMAAGWSASLHETIYTFKSGMPVVAAVTAYAVEGENTKGEKLWDSKTIYAYKQNWLTRSEEIVNEPWDEGTIRTQRFVTTYSNLWPSTPIVKEGYLEGGVAPDFRMEFEYADHGLPKKAAYTIGSYFLDEEFEQHYTLYDQQNNWTKSVRAASGMQQLMERQITYY